MSDGKNRSIYFPSQSLLRDLEALAAMTRRPLNQVILMILENELPTYRKDPSKLVASSAGRIET